MARPDPLRLDRSTRERLDRIGQEFLADILTRETVRRPENLVALSELAHVLTRIGRFEDGLEVTRLCLGCMTYGDPGWRPWILDEEALRSKSHNTPLLGRELMGRPVMTIVGGKVVYGLDT